MIGDDGSEREVTAITSGYGPLYEVSAARGNSYIVNENHILSLRMPDHKVVFWNSTSQGWHVLWLDKEEMNIKSKIIAIEDTESQVQCTHCDILLTRGSLKRHHNRIHPDIPYVSPPRKPPIVVPEDSESVRDARAKMDEFCKTIPDDNTIDISIGDYMKLSKTIQGRLSGYKGECVQWPFQEVDLDPYVMGLWLGDGMQTGYRFAINKRDDPEIIEYLEKWGLDNDATFRQEKSDEYSWTISSTDHKWEKGYAPLRKLLKKYDLLEKKFIPSEYMFNDRKTRLAVLAGLIDSDGHVRREGTRITITQGMVHKELAENIIYLVQSLGLHCSSTIKKTQWRWNGELNFGEAVHIDISGSGVEDIPTLVARKKCAAPFKRETLNTGPVKIKRVDNGNYYGISITGNKRFVLEDFTVTHNCNIFSKRFTVKVGNHITKESYTQTWADNMSKKTEAKVQKDYKAPTSFTEITYEMDFKRVKYGQKDDRESFGYPQECFELFAKHALSFAFNSKVPITFNDHKFKVNSIEEYSKYYFPSQQNFFTYTEYPAGTARVLNPKTQKMEAEDPSILPTVEIYVSDMPDKAECISYVNTMLTRVGGVHVNAAYKKIKDHLLQVLNKNTKKTKKVEKDGKDKEGGAKNVIKATDVKPHISLIMSCRVKNPKFKSQSKTELSSPNVNFTIPQAELDKMNHWDVVERLRATVQAKQFKSLSKTDGKKKRHINLEKGMDANLAGTARSRECNLYVVEGNSAMGYAKKVINLIKDGRDTNGVYPLKGKPLNVMNATQDQLENNEEFKNLKLVLGLRENMDYTIESNFSTLRYGNFVVLADADDDGKHIIGLILNMFYCQYPSLLKRGFVKFLRTPILRIFKHEKLYKSFFTFGEFEDWKKLEQVNIDIVEKKALQELEEKEEEEKEEGEEEKKEEKKTEKKVDKIYQLKYYKGLGTSEDIEIAEDFKAPRVVLCFYDERTPHSINLAFNVRLANERKEWISKM